jgi:hypothetical protein
MLLDVLKATSVQDLYDVLTLSDSSTAQAVQNCLDSCEDCTPFLSKLVEKFEGSGEESCSGRVSTMYGRNVTPPRQKLFRAVVIRDMKKHAVTGKVELSAKNFESYLAVFVGLLIRNERRSLTEV